jgi:hypothetical protein
VKILRLSVLIALFPLAASAQGLPGRPGGPPPRQALERQIFDRFMNRVSNDMRLDTHGRNRLEEHVRQSGQQRRQLNQRAVQLRRELMNAVRNEATSDAEMDRLLKQFNQLRAEEETLWVRDQEALSRMLNPRQRAIFILQWMRFNEQIRDLLQQRPGRGEGPG